MDFTIYDIEGRIRSNGNCPPSDFDLQLAHHPAGCGILEGSWHWTTHRIDLSGEEPTPVEIPAQPSQHHTFDWVAKEWVDPRTPQDLQDAKWAEIKQCREAYMYSTLVTPHGTFDGDAKGQESLKEAVLVAMNFPTKPIRFTLADNSRVTFTAAQILEVGAYLTLKKQAAYDAADELRTLIYAADTDLDEIVWVDPSYVGEGGS